MISRRDFVAKAATAAGATVALACAKGVQTGVTPARGNVPAGATILFQGDSITDAGRERQDAGPNEVRALGVGYPMLLASALLPAYPDRQLKVFNRGNSGNVVPDLQERWDADTIALKPDLVSILIGVNDYWHMHDGDYKGTAADYERQYGALLQETKQRLPAARIVVLEPFALKTGRVDASWWPEFDERRAIAERVAERAGATFVTLHRELEEAAARGGGLAYWVGDGVHPTLAGHALIAARWRQVVGW